MSGLIQDIVESCQCCFNCGDIYATHEQYILTESEYSVIFKNEDELYICEACIKSIIGYDIEIEDADPRKLRDGINEMIENKINKLRALTSASKLYYDYTYKDLEKED